MKIREVVDALERFAPLPLQEDYDNAGLQLGLTDTQEVSGALLCLDVTEAIVDEAVALGCNLIVSHHPLIFRPLKHITDENQVQRTVRKAILNNVALVSMHTNLDNAEGGVNWKIAEHLGAVVERGERGEFPGLPFIPVRISTSTAVVALQERKILLNIHGRDHIKNID